MYNSLRVPPITQHPLEAGDPPPVLANGPRVIRVLRHNLCLDHNHRFHRIHVVAQGSSGARAEQAQEASCRDLVVDGVEDPPLDAFGSSGRAEQCSQALQVIHVGGCGG